MFWPPVLKDFEIVVVVYLKFHDITTHNKISQSFLRSIYTFGKGLGTWSHKYEFKLQLPHGVKIFPSLGCLYSINTAHSLSNAA